LPKKKKGNVNKSLPEIRIGLNESHIRKCSSKQVQLPEAVFQEGNERVVCSGLFFLQKTKEFDYKERKKSVFVKNKQTKKLCKEKLRLYASFLFSRTKKKKEKQKRRALYASVIANCVISEKKCHAKLLLCFSFFFCW
jgi:zona occludens toxin (predicted ATPase)